MILDKVLLLKGLGGVAACTGLGCGATYLINPDLFKTNDQILAELITKVGLTTCTTTSPECSIGNSGLNLKQGEDKAENKTKSTPSTSSGNGKIKVYANNNDYNKGFKFVIEDGDITLDSNNSKKLEQFETYEIKEDSDKKWYLTRKNTALEEKRKILGLPEEKSCKLPTNENGTATCSGITAEKLKTINFKDKESAGAKIATNGTVTLTITKVPSSDTEFATEDYKFSFNPTEEVTISTTNKIAKNSGTEFKIKKEGNTLSLEKAWDITKWGQKVGLTCPAEGNTKECTLPTSETLKLYNSSTDKVENGKVEGSKKIKYQEDVEGHNQGFKFFTENEIALSGDNSSKKIAGSTATYEIKEHTEGDTKKWYLTKKEAPAT